MAVKVAVPLVQMVSLVGAIVTVGFALFIPVKSAVVNVVLGEVSTKPVLDPANRVHGNAPFHCPIKILPWVPTTSVLTYVAATTQP